MKLSPQTQPSQRHTPAQAAHPPAPVLQLTLHREAEGNLLGAQWVLSSAGDFSSISSHYLWYFQDPGAGDGGRLQGRGSPEPAHLCRGLLSATHSSCSAWPSEMRIDEAFCRILRALGESAAGELGEAEVSSLLPRISWPHCLLPRPASWVLCGPRAGPFHPKRQPVWAWYLQGRLGV